MIRYETYIPIAPDQLPEKTFSKKNKSPGNFLIEYRKSPAHAWKTHKRYCSPVRRDNAFNRVVLKYTRSPFQCLREYEFRIPRKTND